MRTGRPRDCGQAAFDRTVACGGIGMCAQEVAQVDVVAVGRLVLHDDVEVVIGELVWRSERFTLRDSQITLMSPAGGGEGRKCRGHGARIGHDDIDVDNRFGPQPRHRRASDMLHLVDDPGQRSIDVTAKSLKLLRPPRVVRNDDRGRLHEQVCAMEIHET